MNQADTKLRHIHKCLCRPGVTRLNHGLKSKNLAYYVEFPVNVIKYMSEHQQGTFLLIRLIIFWYWLVSNLDYNLHFLVRL